jgi:hypothetical protein
VDACGGNALRDYDSAVMIRTVVLPLAASCLLLLAPGCTSSNRVSVKPGDVRLDTADATVAPGFSVRDTDLWGSSDKPFLTNRLGPATIERTRDGAMFVVFSNGRRAEIVALAEGTPGHDPRSNAAPFDRRPADRSERDWIAMLGALLPFISTPYAALPASLEAWLHGPDDELRSAAADLTRHLLDADRATFRGTIGRKGVVNGWMAPTPAAREKLTKALRAVERAKP